MEEEVTACREYAGKRTDAGYVRRTLTGLDGVKRVQMLHRWVVEQAEGVELKPWPDEIVMHTCDNPPCFLYEHLRRATSTDNNRDARAKGRIRQVRGESSPHVKLSDVQVAQLREGRARGLSQRSLAASFGVSRALVRRIVSGGYRP